MTDRPLDSSEPGDRSGRAPALRVHCFGSLEISFAGAALEGFESQKVRALFVYLACHLGQPLTRDHLAAVFWPDKDEEAARRNLRQSLYNLKGLFPQGRSAVRANRQSLQLEPSLDCWVDAVAFEQALESGGSTERLDPHLLTEAIGLYRGAFLSGFQVKDCEEFDFWLGSEQERLREKAVAALRLLIDSYLDRGEFRLGIQYAQRLVAIDPLSEDAHQKLMQLYALSGRRSRALAQYDELERLLRRELDVAPLEATTMLHRRILQQGGSMSDVDAGGGEAIGPMIPMAGRRGEYERLGQRMEAALAGNGLLTVLLGEPGVGKTRLIRSFLDGASSNVNTVILKGRCLDVLPESYQPLSRALGGAFSPGSELGPLALRDLDTETRVHLASFVPEIVADGTSRSGRSPCADSARSRVFESTAKALTALCGLPGGKVRRIVVLLDDLQRADPATLDLLSYLNDRLRPFPVWIVCACTLERLDGEHPLHCWIDEELAEEDRIELQRLQADSIYEVASSLVPQGQATELSEFLGRVTGGLPHLLTECINYLRDQGHLMPDSGRWTLAESLAGMKVQVSDLKQVIATRYEHLPHSARRLAALAAVSGSRFDPQLICEAGEEHPGVSQIAFDVMLQRWLIRRASDQWQHRQPSSDETAPAGDGARFEFSSETIWQTIYDQITPARRRLMHANVARTLETTQAPGSRPLCEVLAHHFRAAGIHERAQHYLEESAAKAANCGAIETAALYFGLAAEEARSQMEAKAADLETLAGEVERLDALRARLQPASQTA